MVPNQCVIRRRVLSRSGRLAVAAIFLCVVGTAFAQLQWDRKLVELRASPDEEMVGLSFPFKNAGERPVSILRVAASCGCTTAAVAKRNYAHGERGEVSVVFEIGNRKGFQEKTVLVVTDDPVSPETTLAFRVIILKTVVMTPTVLFWKPGEKTQRSIRIKVFQKEPLNLVKAVCSSPAWRVELHAVKPGREYALDVTPLDPPPGAAGVVTITADSPADFPQLFQARLRIK